MTSPTPRRRRGDTPDLILAWLAAQDGATTASAEHIAAQVGRGRTAVKDAIGTLEDDGRITVIRRRRNRHTGDPTGRTITVAGGAR